MVLIAYSLLIGFKPSSSGLNFVSPTGTMATDRTVLDTLLWNFASSKIDFLRMSPSFIPGHTTI